MHKEQEHKALEKALSLCDREEAKIDEGITLPSTGTWPETRHLFDTESLWAIKTALTARRPLLIRGEPGTGKSQLARAAAHILGRVFISTVLHGKSESRDLMFHFDAVRRLGKAQELGALAAKGHEDMEEKLAEKHFLTPGVLWWAFDWESASAQYEAGPKTEGKPVPPPGWNSGEGAVLLVDEIDKADSDLPNGLLETLGNGCFSLPYRDEPIGICESTPPPLVMITTNEERELPRAFVRRCLVLNLELPRERNKLLEELLKKGEVHFGISLGREVMKEAAEQLIKDREEAASRQHAPGQAEYLDLLRALKDLGKDKETRLAALQKIKHFVLKKNPREW